MQLRLPYLKSVCSASALILASTFNSANAEPAYEPIINYHPSSIFAQFGKAVGRLRIQTSRGHSGCTAFLISEIHLMTNEHCVGKRAWDHKNRKWLPREVHKVKVEMAAVNPKDKTKIETFAVQMPPLEINEAFDYAILKVDGNPASRFGYLSISTQAPEAKIPLWIIGHPKLKVQQISRIACRVISANIYGKNSFTHTCPTIGGSSGSPVFDASTGSVIGLNHARDASKIPQLGYAIPFSKIAKQSSLLREIIKAQ